MRRALLAFAAVLSCLIAPTPWIVAPAGAQTIEEKRAEAARISKELDAQGERISILAEQYNNARLEAERLDAEVSSAKATMQATDTKADKLRSRLKGQAVDSYVRGGAIPALSMLVESKLQDDIAVRRQYVDSVTNQIGDTLDDLRSVKMTLQEQQSTLADAQRKSKDALAAVEASRTKALAAQRSQEQLLAKVQGEIKDLVAAEEKRKAEEQARKAQAELAARRAREEAAAREAAAREAAARDAASRRASATTTTAAPTRTASPTTTTTAKPAPASDPSAPPPNSGAAAAIEEAKRQLGKPYEYGGSGPDTFDCSGLTSWAWRAGGKSLPHSSQSQYSATSRVSLSNIQPGDLLFYGSPIHHVALYVGNGQMIEAPETGKNVRYASIYRSDYVGAGRVY